MGHNYKRILLCNGAFLGDLILSTAVLPVLRAAWPETKIGFLIGSWALPVIKDHADVDWIHIFDNPHLSRASIPEKKKKKIGNKTWHEALQEICEKQYDAAIDLYYFYRANSGKLLAKAQVPHRFGFWASPTHFTYTERFFWDHRPLHMVENHGMMLRHLEIEEKYLIHLKPTLRYRTSIESYSLPIEYKKNSYLAVHVGAGDPRRLWNLPAWKQLIQKLDTLALPIVFLGKGNQERELIHELLPLSSRAISLCDQLSWRQLFPIVENARMLIGLESMAGHLAAIHQTPAVVIYGREANVSCWRPFHPSCHVVTAPRPLQPLPKSKRYRFAAIHTIQPDEVFAKVQELLHI